MRWIMGFMLFLVAVPCWAGGQDQFREAEDLWQKSEKEKAVTSYLAAIKSGELSEPQRIMAHYNVAIFYFLAEDAKKAIENTDKILISQPNHVGALSLRANCYDRLKDDAHALADWDKLLEIDPNDALVYNDRSYFYLDRGDLNKAISEMETYIKMQPDSPEQLQQLDKLKAKRSQQSKAL
jgi:tetratricopeptide (TPR) repeat protein